MKKNYYDELINKLKKLVNENKNNEAITLIEEELKLPYIPIIYEKEILSIYNSIKKYDNKKTNSFSREEIIDIFLKYSKEHTNDFLFEIANMMSSYNWNDYINDLEKIFSLNSINNNIKGSIYNSLSINNLNHDFIINEIKLNPCRNYTVFETEFATKNFDQLSNNYFGEPTLVEIAKKVLLIYLLNTFPNSMNIKYKNIVDDLISIAKVMIGQIKENELNDEQLKIYNIIKK